MIGKQIKGRGFRGLLNYLQSKQRAELIGGNMIGETPRELAAEFRFSRQLNRKVERTVYHASLSLPLHERLEQDQWNALVEDYLKGMGFDYNQYCVFRHYDKKHDHVHIVASRIKLDGSCVHDSWDYVRSEKLLRLLEKKYGLSAPQVRDPGRASPTTGQKRRLFREQAEYEFGVRSQPPEPTISSLLQAAIDAATLEQPTMPQLINRLKDQSIDALVSFYSTGRVQGITYSLEGIRFSGTKLGRDYTFFGLQKHRGIDYDSARDDQVIKCLNERSVEANADTDTTQSLAPAPQVTLVHQAVAQVIAQEAAQERSVFSNIAFEPKLPDLANSTGVRSIPDVGQVEQSAAAQDVIEQQHVQFIATLMADYLLEKKAKRLDGKRYTVYWEGTELVLVQISNSKEILRTIYKNECWEPVGSPQLKDAQVKDFQEMAFQIQHARAAAIAPIAIQLFEASQEVKVHYPGVGRLEGIHYILTDDLVEKTFSIQAKDGRGELVRVNRHEGNALLSAQRIEIRDIANFQRIQQAINQQREFAKEGVGN